MYYQLLDQRKRIHYSNATISANDSSSHKVEVENIDVLLEDDPTYVAPEKRPRRKNRSGASRVRDRADNLSDFDDEEEENENDYYITDFRINPGND